MNWFKRKEKIVPKSEPEPIMLNTRKDLDDMLIVSEQDLRCLDGDAVCAEMIARWRRRVEYTVGQYPAIVAGGLALLVVDRYNAIVDERDTTIKELAEELAATKDDVKFRSRQVDNLLLLVDRIEWEGQAFVNGKIVMCCPLCKGVKPDITTVVGKAHVGHWAYCPIPRVPIPSVRS